MYMKKIIGLGLFLILAAVGCGGDDWVTYESPHGWMIEHPPTYELDENAQAETNTMFLVPSESPEFQNNLIVAVQRMYGSRIEFIDLQKTMREGLEEQSSTSQVEVEFGEHASGDQLKISFLNATPQIDLFVMQAFVRNEFGDHVFLSMTAHPDDWVALRQEFNGILERFDP
ncbi:MAG: hypothetical protein CMI52_01510 [Parcubacteria group bacterium]|nr:hypothetical protein [Parcubacteria group bacterium]|tara:strand:- start:658 stop:1173 length:516 start_codon:yes stop_codon:yes gene_type:complete